MSAHVDFLRQGYEALERGDLDTFRELARERLAPDFEGVEEWIADTRDTWEGYTHKAEEIVDLGNQVLVVLSISGRGGESGVPVAQELAVLWTFEGERAVQARSFTSRAEAFEAAGKEEPPPA